MKGRFLVSLVGVIVVGLGVGAGAGALQDRWSGNNGAQAVAASQQARAADSNSAPSELATQFGGVGGILGTVDSVSSSGFVLVAQSGQVQVAVSGETRVQKTADIKAIDLKVGDTIVATGEQEADGSLAAVSIEVGALEAARGLVGGMMGQLAPGATRAQNQSSGQRGGQQSGQQGAPQTRGQGMQAQRGSMVAGAIEAASGDIITVKTQAGASTKVKLSSTTALRKMADGSLQDVKAGQSVLVMGERDSGGTLKAASVQVIPAGQARSGR
ncbi:MAG: hypothetical protein HYX94_10505 [Chloroflexi bacterium]|nr:hypothetical protein [Chloroflexota bacterium]